MSVRVEEALPLAGTVTGLGRLTVTPLGTTPVHPAVRATVELNPFSDENTIDEDLATPGVKVITAGDG